MIGLLLALVASSTFDTAYNSPYSHAVPPPRYRHNLTITIEFADEHDVEVRCGKGKSKPPPGSHYSGCSLSDGTLLVPNSCYYVDQVYARTLCHEIGHANGWPANHPAK